MSKKKILYVVEAMGGGVFTYIVDLANELVNEFDMYIAYAVRPQTPSNYKEYFDKRIHLREVKFFCREIKPAQELKAIKEVKTIAEEVKPDIIHLHSSKAGVIGRIAFKTRKRISIGYDHTLKRLIPCSVFQSVFPLDDRPKTTEEAAEGALNS